jgi:hypothetical protein
VLPDIDMLWFWFVDHSTLHHYFFPHLPVFWAVVAVMWYSGLALFMSHKRWLWTASCLFFSGILLHLMLDTISGGVAWLYPWNDQLYVVFANIPAKFDWWVWSFVFHYSFVVELVIVVWAVILYRRESIKGKKY